MLLHQVFFCPIFTFRFENHSKYDFPMVEKMDRKPDGWIESVNSTFPRISDDDPVVFRDERNNLMRDLGEQMKDLFQQYQLPDKFSFDQFWYNIYHEYQGQEPHTHLNGCFKRTPYWCGIYYYRGATPTTFFRPDCNNRVHKFPHASPIFQEYFADKLKPDLKDGDVILFPPYIQHCVEPCNSATMRMTFSFNLVLDNE